MIEISHFVPCLPVVSEVKLTDDTERLNADSEETFMFEVSASHFSGFLKKKKGMFLKLTDLFGRRKFSPYLIIRRHLC
jgi:hypothetical protein